jgi:hypothetical protein
MQIKKEMETAAKERPEREVLTNRDHVGQHLVDAHGAKDHGYSVDQHERKHETPKLETSLGVSARIKSRMTNWRNVTPSKSPDQS